MDKDKNGFVEVVEAPQARVTRKVGDGPTQLVASGSGTWIEEFDRNYDGRVALDEFQQRMVVILRAPGSSFNRLSPGEPTTSGFPRRSRPILQPRA
jgi:hypothetical protein